MAFDRFDDPKYKKWAKAVKSRDNYTCIICLRDNIYLHSHHLNSWDTFVEERYNVENGATLCHIHHDMFHQLYKKGKNTKFQFEEFKQIIKIIEKIAKEKK